MQCPVNCQSLEMQDVIPLCPRPAKATWTVTSHPGSIMLLVNEPNTILGDKELCCYISILLKPHLYRTRLLPERNVPCKET